MTPPPPLWFSGVQLLPASRYYLSPASGGYPDAVTVHNPYSFAGPCNLDEVQHCCATTPLELQGDASNKALETDKPSNMGAISNMMDAISSPVCANLQTFPASVVCRAAFYTNPETAPPTTAPQQSIPSTSPLREQLPVPRWVVSTPPLLAPPVVLAEQATASPSRSSRPRKQYLPSLGESAQPPHSATVVPLAPRATGPRAHRAAKPPPFRERRIRQCLALLRRASPDPQHDAQNQLSGSC
eukprot:GGOE01006235.1.p2 GENE.GGOE01006235.1~~GGOE01006235.1.p2  ORF type:complete len:272 (+),score=4.42 GGOE01006235.1:91-816(+)